MSVATRHTGSDTAAWEHVALVDLLDRVLATGVVITGEVTLAIADVDLVYVCLQALVSSVRAGGPGPVLEVPDDRVEAG